MNWYPSVVDQLGSSAVYVVCQLVLVLPAMVVVRRLVRGSW